MVVSVAIVVLEPAGRRNLRAVVWCGAQRAEESRGHGCMCTERTNVVRGEKPDEICQSNMSGRVGGLVRTHWVSRWLLLRTRVHKPRALPACVKAARDEGCVSAW